MIFNIYDYEGRATEVDTGDKIIKRLLVQLLFGDEIVMVMYDDGTNETFDSCDYRRGNCMEAFYFVDKSHLQDWIGLESTDPDERMHKFYELLGEE